MDRVDQFRRVIFWGFRILLTAATFLALFSGHWKEAVFLAFTLFMTFLTSIIEKKIEVDYPSELEIIILLFIIASIYLGDLKGFYQKYLWWDAVLHALSGIIVGGIGFSVVFILNSSKKIVFKLSPKFVCFFAFCFAVTMGVIWEIYEFAMDQMFDLKMQRLGLEDTMWDLIVDCLGALLFAAIGYFHIKGDFRLFQWLEEKFFKLNPSWKE